MKLHALCIGRDSAGKPFVAWHWPWSLTWSWGFWVSDSPAGRLGLHHMRTNGGRIVVLNTRWFSVHFQSQQTMSK